MEDWRMERQCAREKCRKPFTPIRKAQVHCSAACRRLWWNESRVTMRISKEAAKRKSLRTDFRNPIIAVGKERLRNLPDESRGILLGLAVELILIAKKKIREAVRLENFHEAENWRALSVFAAQVSVMLKRNERGERSDRRND
jgi:hypothetical protein